MSLDDLLQKNKKMLVDHAFIIYGVPPENNLRKKEWVDYLLNGGNFELMLEKLKLGKVSVADGMPKLPGRTGQIYNDLISAIRMHELA